MNKTEAEKIWKSRVKNFKSSTLSLTAWCKENNVKSSSFRYWLDKDKGKNSKSKPKSGSVQEWIPIEVNNKGLNNSLSKNSLVVKVGAASIEVQGSIDKQLFKDVIEVLVKTC